MIEAAVLVMAVGFAMAIGYMWGSKSATESILSQVQDIPVKAGDQLLGELLENPDTSFNAKKALQGFLASGTPNPLTNGFKVVNKKIVKN